MAVLVPRTLTNLPSTTTSLTQRVNRMHPHQDRMTYLVGPPVPGPVNRSRSPRRRTSTLRIAGPLPAPAFDLTENQVPMPHRAEDIRKLCGLWPPNWLDYTIEGLKLEDATQGAASHWEALLSGENARELEIHLYSDGSASEAEQRSGYGVVVLVKAGVAFALLGIIAEQSHGAQDTPWPTGAPLPLRAEQIGLAVILYGITTV